MMAELIVTKKEIGPQLKKFAGTSRARPKSLGAGGQRLPLAGRLWAEHLIVWFRSLEALLAAGFAASVRTPAEGKIGADTAARTLVIQGQSQDRRHGKRPRSGHAGLNMACRASVQPEGRGVTITPVQNPIRRRSRF
jgi:hypothetical protein